MWINSSLPPSNSFSYSGDNCWSIPGYPSLSFLDTSGDVLSLHQRDGNTWTKASPHWSPWSTNGRSEEIILGHFFILCVATLIIIIIFCCFFVFFFFPHEICGEWETFLVIGTACQRHHCMGLLTRKTLFLRDKTRLEGPLRNLN